MLIVKGDIILDRFWRDTELVEPIIQMALAKLPTSMQARFTDERKLSSLRQFMQKHLFEETSKETVAADQFHRANQTPGRNEYCVYCRKVGHIRNQCPEKMALLCSRCLNWGHTLRICHSAAKVVTLDDIV